MKPLQQDDLFPSDSRQNIDLEGFGLLQYFPRWLHTVDADRYFACLDKELCWSQPEITVYGRSHRIPRLQAWYGDAKARMSYSGMALKPEPWHQKLLLIKQKIEAQFNCSFNSVLANCYRDGGDGVGWHADDERELGQDPLIASVSLGASRVFSLKPKSAHLDNASLKKRDLLLCHGDLLLMSGATQKFWQHALMKDKHAPDKRINLTYRLISTR